MIRLLLAIVVIVCIAAAVIAVIRSPAIQRSEQTESEDAGTSASALDVRRVGTAATRNATAARRAPTPPSASGSLSGATPPPATRGELGRRRVLADQTVVYSRNSEHGEVLALLQEGDEVELGVSVLDEEGLWVEVRLNAESAGFVRSETLSVN